MSVAVGYAPNSLETLARTMFLSVLVYVLVELYVERRVANAVYEYAMKQKHVPQADSSKPTKSSSVTERKDFEQASASSPPSHSESNTTTDVDAAEKDATIETTTPTRDEIECNDAEYTAEAINDTKSYTRCGRSRSW